MITKILRGCTAIALLSVATPLNSFAQKPSGHIAFQWGEEYELPKRHEDLGFVGNATDGYIQIAHRNRESLSFQKFDASLHLKGEQEVDISNLPRNYVNEFFTQLGDKYYWFFSTYEKSEDKETLFAQEIDLKTGTVKGSAREIVTTSAIGNA